jgi:hypothetical protein
MEFFENVQGVNYQFSMIRQGSFLVSGPDGDYILYKGVEWKCADLLHPHLLQGLALAIERNISLLHA